MTKYRITIQALNGATGEIRELVANIKAQSEQEAANTLFSRARKDDYYFRFLGHRSVITPNNGTPVSFNGQTYYSAA